MRSLLECTVLVVDDTEANIDLLVDTLGDDYGVTVALDGEAALELVKEEPPDLILLDIMMPGIDGYEVCERLKANEATQAIPVIFLTAMAEDQDEARGLELGAVDYITKPFNPGLIKTRVRNQLELKCNRDHLEAMLNERTHELALSREYRAEALRRIEGPLVGGSPAAMGLRAAVEQYAASREPLLLVATPGCGAEAVARTIHDASPRSDGPFVMMECAILTIAAQAAVLQPSSGGDESKAAKFGLARGGTLYLRGVDQLPPDLQILLLDILTSGESERLDIRIISTTAGLPFPPVYNQALSREFMRRQLRLPTLAERRDDIPALVKHFLDRYARELGKALEGVADDSLSAMQEYSWPGNLRELGDVIHRSVVNSTSKTLRVDSALLEEGVPLGGYRLVRRLGTGAMGEVWQAKHQLLARKVAVKLVKPDVLASAKDRAKIIHRFEREAQVTANLRSPNSVEIFDFGVNDEGALYYVMELLDGLDLQQLVKSFGPLDISRAVNFLIQACNSLAEAHAVGLVHRDIKPANLFACKLGLQTDVLKVLDFGLVTGLDSEDLSRLTRDGSTFGTPSTMSPEACLNSADVDDRSDVYSLGCVAYWLLSAHMPFTAESMSQLVIKHIQETPPLISEFGVDIPPGLDSLMLSCLAKAPENRPDAEGLAKALEASGLAQGWTQAEADAWWSEYLPAIYERPLPASGKSE